MHARCYLFYFLCLFLSFSSQGQAPSIADLEAYLNSFTTLEANFVQINPDGSKASGQFLLKRPHNLKFAYQHPTGYTILAKDGWLELYDPSFDDTSYLELDFTPARFFLSKEINLNKDIIVKGIFPEGEEGISLVLTDTNQSALVTLIFTLSPLTLRGWRILDQQRQFTQLFLTDLKINKPLSDKMFSFAPKKLSH